MNFKTCILLLGLPFLLGASNIFNYDEDESYPMPSSLKNYDETKEYASYPKDLKNVKLFYIEMNNKSNWDRVNKKSTKQKNNIINE